MRFDTRNWLIWVALTAAITIVARNPFYSLAVIIVTQIVVSVCSPPDAAGKRLPTVRIGAAILLFTTLFHALSIHIGETELFQLPVNWPLLGGKITLEAAAFGFSSGLVLLALLFVFATFNALVPSDELVRLTPRAMRDLGIVVLIAFTYVPQTRRQLQRVREAQAIRGHRMHGVADWRPIIIPLLIGSLERAIGVAEAMVSRGYGASNNVRQPLSVQISLVIGLLLTLAGWMMIFWVSWLGILLLTAGVGLVLMLTVQLGRQVERTIYQRNLWTRHDYLMLVSMLLPLVLVFIDLPFVNRATLVYIPYPSLGWPQFDPLVGFGLACLAMPALLVSVRK